MHAAHGKQTMIAKKTRSQLRFEQARTRSARSLGQKPALTISSAQSVGLLLPSKQRRMHEYTGEGARGEVQTSGAPPSTDNFTAAKIRLVEEREHRVEHGIAALLKAMKRSCLRSVIAHLLEHGIRHALTRFDSS